MIGIPLTRSVLARVAVPVRFHPDDSCLETNCPLHENPGQLQQICQDTGSQIIVTVAFFGTGCGFVLLYVMIKYRGGVSVFLASRVNQKNFLAVCYFLEVLTQDAGLLHDVTWNTT